MRPSRTREERAQNNLYLNDQDLVREHQKQAEEKRRMKQMQELQDKEDTLNHYRNYNLGGNMVNDPETAEMMEKLQQEEDFLSQLKAKLENQDPDFYIKMKEEQMQKQRKDKTEQYHKIHSENNDPNEFMFVRDPTSGQQLSKGEMERQKRLQLREQERQRRLMGQESSAYDQQKRDQPLSLPFQLEQQINGASEEERKQKRLNDLFDDPPQPLIKNTVDDDAFRQTQSNFHHFNQNQNNQEDFANNNNIYSSQNQQPPSSNNQNSRKNLEAYEETDIFGNKKAKRMIKSENVNKPIDNVYQGEQEGNYQSPQQNNLYSQNTQKLQQNFSNNRRRSFHENQQDEGKLPSIQGNNRKSNDLSNKQNQGGNSNIFGIGGNQVDSKKEKMLKYRQELDQQKEMKNQIGYSIKPYSAQQERRGTYNGGSPQSGLPPQAPSNNNKDRDGFFDKFGQDPQFKKNLQNWEQQQKQNLQNQDQFKPYSAQVSRDVKNTPGRPPIDPNINNNNNDNFFDKFGQDQPQRQQLRRPQSYQNLDEKQNMGRMSKQEYADYVMRDMMGRNNTQEDRRGSNIGNNNSYQQNNLNRSLNNLDEIKQNDQESYLNRYDNYNSNNNNNPYQNQQQQPQQYQQQQQIVQPAGVFMTDAEEQKYRQREKQRMLQKELEDQIKLKKQMKEEEKRKNQEYDQKFLGGQDKPNAAAQNRDSQRGGQQQQQQNQQLGYQPSRDYDAVMNNNEQQLSYNPSAPNLYEQQQQQYDPYSQQQQQPSQQQQIQQQQQQPNNFARNKVLHNETVDRDGQQKAMEAKKRYAEELNQQKLEAEQKKQEEKRRKQQEDLLEEQKMMKQIEEEKRKQEEEKQNQNRKKLEIDEFNKNKKVEHEVGGKQERVKAGRNLEQNPSEQDMSKRKPNFHQTQNQNKLDDFDQVQQQKDPSDMLNRHDLFEKNQSIQQQNMEDNYNPYNNESRNMANPYNNQNQQNINNQFDMNQQMYSQNQQPFMQNNQFQQGGMQNNPLFPQNANMMNMNWMMPQGNQYGDMYNQYQMMMQQQNMMQMMSMDHQYFNQMFLPPNLQYFLYNRNEFEIQKHIMEEKLHIHKFALQKQNLVDEYRQRLNKAKEDKEQFEREILRMKHELENNYGEKVNMQLFSQIILDDSSRNRQSSIDSYHNLQQSIANFKKNTDYLDQQIQQKQTHSNFFPNSSQKPPLNSNLFNNKQSTYTPQLNQTKNQNTTNINEKNDSLYDQIRRLEDIQINEHPLTHPIKLKDFEGTLQCNSELEHINGFDFDVDKSYMRDKNDFELHYNNKNQSKQYQNDQQNHPNSRLSSSSNNQNKFDQMQSNKRFENSNLLQVPEAISNNANNAHIQQSFMQKTYQSQMMQSMNPSMNMNTNPNQNFNISSNNPNSQQNQQHIKSQGFHSNSQALNINLNDPSQVIQELPREEMDDTSKNNDKSLLSNQFQRQQSSSQSQQSYPKQEQNKIPYRNFDRQNLIQNMSDFNEEGKRNQTIKKEEEDEYEEQDQFYTSGYAQSEFKKDRDNNSQMHPVQTNESQHQYQSQLVNLELKKTADYYKLFQEHFPSEFGKEHGKESRNSKYNDNSDDDEEGDENNNFNNRQKVSNKDKFNSKEDYEEIEEDEDGFENDGYEVNKYYNNEQIIEEDIEGTGTDNHVFDDKLHFDSEQKKKLKQAIAEINRNSNELGQLENQYKPNKDASITSNKDNLSKDKSPQANQVNQNQKQNTQREVSYQQIQQHLDETVNVPKKEKGEDDGLGQTQISEIHSTLKETDMDKKIPTNVMKLLRQHTDLLHNSQNLEDNQNNKNLQSNAQEIGQKNNSRMPAAPKNNNIMIQQNFEVKKSTQEINWEMQQQQMIDQQSHKFQSQHWNQQSLSNNKKKSTQNKIEDEIPEVIDFTQQQEIEMKEAEFNNPEQSLALPEDELDKEKIDQFIESSSGYKNHTKLSDPEDQQTMQSEEFDNNDDFQRHLQLNMIKNLNNQLKEQHGHQVKNIKIRPYSANMPLISNLASRQNPNIINSTNINVNSSNLTTYSTNNNNNHNNNNINNYNSNNNNQDKRSTGGFKKPKTIDVFGKITSPKNNIPTLEQSGTKNNKNNTQHEDSYQSNQPPLFQYKQSNTSYEQSQFINNFNNTNNPQHKMVSMTRMDDQTGIYNNLVNPSSVLYEEESYQFGGKNSSQPSFLRHDITTGSNIQNNFNTNTNKPASSTQSLPKKSDMILNRLENLISNLENSSEQQQIKQTRQSEDKSNNKNILVRQSYNQK